MPIIVREGHDSRQFKVDNKGASAQWKGCAYGSQDQDAIYNAVLSSEECPATLSGMNRRSINGVHRGAGFWDVTVDFEPPEGVPLAGQGGAGGGGGEPAPGPELHDPLGQEFSFDTAGGTAHVTQSLATQLVKARVPARPVPDRKGAIGVTRDGKVGGCDIGSGKLEFSYSRRVAYITLAYILQLKEATYTTNFYRFLHFYRGELLFLGASGQWRNADGWTINYKFAASRNEETVTICDDLVLTYADRGVFADAAFNESATDPAEPADPLLQWAKLGWEFVDVAYREQTDAAARISLAIPEYAALEKVYRRTDFALYLGWGRNA